MTGALSRAFARLGVAVLLVVCACATWGGDNRIFRPERPIRGNTGLEPLQPLDGCEWRMHPAHLQREVPEGGLFLRFRHAFESDGTPLELDVTADERYVLFLDGERVGRGPSRGTRENWLYESRRLTPAKGPHVLEAAVWALGEQGPHAQLSYRPGAFILKAYGTYDAQLSTTRGNVWQVGEVTTTTMTDKGESGSFGIGCQTRQVGCGHETAQPTAWTNAVAADRALADWPHGGGVRRGDWELYPSPLPDQKETYFAGEAFTVPAHTRKHFYWDLGVYRCGYPELFVSGGKGAKVSWNWAESLVDEHGQKGNRAAREGKHMVGFGDTFIADGRVQARFSAPWWRCGRWCEIAVETGDESITVDKIGIIETRYPLEDEGGFTSDDKSLDAVRALCLHGLQMCAHEMVFDCPFYEQQMYPGDTRVQLLVHGAVSSDARLRRRAIEIFDRARRSEGYVAMNFPNRHIQDCAPYTMCHILMHGDYARWCGADAWLKARLPGITHALTELGSHEDETGLLVHLPGWLFYDWPINTQGWWKSGCVGTEADGASALDNLFYILSLESAATAASACGETDLAEFWRRRAARTRAAVRTHFWNAQEGLLQDRLRQRGPYSEHAQALGILAGAIPEDQAARHFANLQTRKDLVRATVYFKYYLFEAYVKRGHGEGVLDDLDLWRDYLAKGLSTPLESPDGAFGPGVESRSDCHGWGAHPIYFFATAIAGITPAENGFARACVAPKPGALKRITAKLPTLRGTIEEHLTFADGLARGTVMLPKGMTGEFTFGEQRQDLVGGVNVIFAPAPTAKTISLDGAWEMAYQPYPWEEGVKCPQFTGVRIANAVPGYWEDMVPQFRAAGLKDEFRINPRYEKVTLPVTGWASETTLPDIYGCFFYRRTIRLDTVQDAVLAFEGVRNQVHVWVNGQYAAHHAGFSTPFELKIKKHLLKVGANEIVLAVSNNPNLGYLGAVVCGLTTRSLFRSTGGVNGHLELRLPQGDITDAYVTTARDLKTFTVHVCGQDAYTWQILDGTTIKAQGDGRGDFALPATGYEMWSPEQPKLYTLVLQTRDGEMKRPFGIRRLVSRGEKLYLNECPVYLRGVTEHCYFAETVHVPRDLNYYRKITAKRKELGFNFVRFHTFVPPVEYLQATDELGMLVHIETPNFVPESEFAAIVRFARKHPSVVIYCTGNETRIDRLVEVYLQYVADIVHRESDALFSPMSALRGVEYALVPGKDVIAQAPFACNAERAQRLAKFCDLFTSYQLSVASYDYLYAASARELDRWGDAYCGKPRLSHEICIDGTYADLSLESRYPKNSPIVKAGVFSEVRRVLAEKGIIGRADLYFRNSCEWMWRLRKYCFEKLRSAERTVGYDFLGDINTHWHTFGYSVGMMDEFYRLKPGESVENVLRYNSAAVLLNDLDGRFNFTSGEKKRIGFTLSNYAADVASGRLTVTLETPEGAIVSSQERTTSAVGNGGVRALGEIVLTLPDAREPRKYWLKAAFAGGVLKVANQWEVYVFPKREAATPTNVRIVADISKDDLLAALAKGERVLLLGAGPFKSLPMTFMSGRAGRCAGNYATVLKAGHPALGNFPHEGYCGWQFRALFDTAKAVQLEAGVPFDPILDIASSVKYPIRQAGIFEYRVGEGRLLVCSLDTTAADAAARWLKAQLTDYAASRAFQPAQTLTPAQLAAVIDAPRLSAAANPNVARNPDDESSEVRAGKLALP